MSEVRKQVPSTAPTPAPGEATPEQLEARRELLTLMRRHNPEPSAEEIAELERQWDQG